MRGLWGAGIESSYLGKKIKWGRRDWEGEGKREERKGKREEGKRRREKREGEGKTEKGKGMHLLSLSFEC